MKRSMKQLLSAVLTLAMLLSLPVIPAGAAELRTKWDYRNWDKDTTWGADEKVVVQGETKTVSGLEIDASASGAKYDATNAGTNWIQVNKGTIIKIPVAVPDGHVAVLTAEFFNAGQFTVDGTMTNSKAGGTKETFDCAGTGGYITIEGIADSGYIGYLSVAYKEGQLGPALNLDQDSVVIKKGESATVKATVTNGTISAVNQSTSDPAGIVTTSEAKTSDTVGTVTITGDAVGETTVTVSVTVGGANPLTKPVAVRVLPEQIGTVEENKTYTFLNASASDRSDLYYSPGLEWVTAMKLDNSHGPYAGNPSMNIYIPDGQQTTLTVKTCAYGAGTGATLTVDGKTVEGVESDWGETSNGASIKGRTFTIEGATGKTVLSFGGGTIYVHEIGVGTFTAADPDAGDKFETKTWNIEGAAADVFNGTFAADHSADTNNTLDGLKLVGKGRRQTGHGAQLYNGTTVEIPVPGDCDIKVSSEYKLYVWLGEDSAFYEDQGKAVTLYYRGEPGTVLMYSGSDSDCYVTKIELMAPSETIPAAIRLDREQGAVDLKMDGTKTAAVNVNTRSLAADAEITATAADPAVATATYNKDTGKIDITAVGAGETTVTAQVVGNDALKTKAVKVVVEPAGEVVYYVDEGTHNFASTDKTTADVRGITWNNMAHIGNGHGVEATADKPVSVTLNLKGKADIVVTTCCYGVGENLTMTASTGTLQDPKLVEEETAKNGKIFTVVGAEGETTLTFSAEQGGTMSTSSWAWIHSIMVSYAADPSVKRNIDVWDIAGQKVENTDTLQYTNNITPEIWVSSQAVAGGTFSGTGKPNFGDLSLVCESNDRLYTTLNCEGMDAVVGGNNGGNYSYDYTADIQGETYKSNGGLYFNGTGSASKRYAVFNRMQQGDKLVAYVGSAQNGDVTFHFEGQGAAAGQNDTATATVGTYGRFVFVAENSGTYKFWSEGGGKALYHRFVRYPGVAVSGQIEFPVEFDVTGYEVKFVNKETKQITLASVAADGSYTVTLAPGYTYNAMLTKAVGWGFTTATKTVATTDAESLTGKTGVDLVVEAKETYTYSGSFTGFAAGYDTSKLAVTMIPDETSGADEVALTVNTDLTFTAKLDPGVDYTLKLEGVNDYVIKTPTAVNNEADTAEDIVVEPKSVYTASGKFAGLGADGKVTALTFVNEEDQYEYTATVADGGYTVSLRDGAYSSKATVEGPYSTMTHVVVDGKAAEKDLLFVSTATKPAVDWVADVYVGYPDKANNYATVNEAVDAISRMGVDSEAKRVTVHIAPGTYREQVIVKTPYVTFINDEPTKGEVLLTWYYGIGYKYYSSNGFYDAQRAYDKYEKKIADRWGTSVRVQGKGFRAENITFENSFNRYITEEELADGVEVSGTETITLERNYAADVTSKEATERAAAMCVEADECEFYNCKFYSSQDTLYTLGKVYFKNCLIEGQTDYIFGDVASKCIFDTCQLSWKGYSSKPKEGYITALRSNAGEPGYLFRSCAVTANDDVKLAVVPGYWGRPWGADANVKFVNTKVETADLIVDVGWHEMSGSKPENAQFGEYNTTTMTGQALDTSKRVTGTVMTQAQAEALKMSDYFGSWIPFYYKEEAATVAFATEPYITDNGDINIPYPGHTLTVHYSLGEANDANDASVIEWYRVAADGTETLVKASNAAADKTYKIAKADVDSTIKVKVTPTTISGKTGEAKSAAVIETVKDGWDDPSAPGSDPTLGDGVNIFLAGDSTVKDYSAKGMYNGGKTQNEGAWGEFIQAFFDDSKVTILNYAQGGRSTRSFINEGTLDAIAKKIGEGDYLFIQFGHNDASNGDAGHLRDRHAPLGTPDANGVYPSTPGVKGEDGTYTWDCGGTYKWYLQQYIDVAKNAGAIPVLVTPVSRMYYNSDGTIKAHHDETKIRGEGSDCTQWADNNNKTNSYCTAVRQLAEEQDVLLLDAFELTKGLFEDAYKASSNDSYGKQIMSTGEKTHNNKLGGMVEAAVIAQAIQGMGLNISKIVKAPAQVLGATPNGVKVFSVDGKGAFEAFDMLKDYGEHATYWEGVGQKLFDDIAAKAKELNSGAGEEPTPGPGEEPTPSGTLELDKDAVTVKAGKTDKVTATVTGYEGLSVYAVSEDTGVATVSVKDKTITVKGEAKGATSVYVVMADTQVTLAQAKADPSVQVVAVTVTKAGTGGGATSSGSDAGTKPIEDTTLDTKADKKVDSKGNVTVTVTDENGEVLAKVEVPAEIPASGKTFKDVPADHWAATSIETVAALGMVKGVGEDTYDMVSPITRGSIATILFRFSQGKTGIPGDFADVAKDAWYTDGVAWAAKAGIVNGYSETAFGPEDAVTREQLAVMLYRYAQLLGLSTSAAGNVDKFADSKDISSWAGEAMAWCVGKGILQGKGDGTVTPTAPATRAEAACMLARFVDLLK